MKKGAKAKGFEVWSVVRVGDAVERGDSLRCCNYCTLQQNYEGCRGIG